MRISRSTPIWLCFIGALGCQPKPVVSPVAEAPRASSPGALPLRSPAEIAAQSTPSIVSVHTEHALGTGFIVASDGLIATNLHVVAGNSNITVTLTDQREFRVVEVWNGDRQRDLVILRIQAQKLPILALGDSNAIRPGDAVVAIGHPLGLEDTVSNGLVSAIRKVDADMTVLQISAPIAPGSSGGPIFNDHGEVIGVATAIMLGGQNLNFGVPVGYVKDLLRESQPVSLEAFASMTAEADDTHPPGHAKRNVPALPMKILDGCSRGSVALIVKSIGEAIEIGAPLYNDGNFAGCYHVYDGAAGDLERKLVLESSCQKPAKALAEGRRKASHLASASDQAWAMRDTFDGLVEVIKRKGERKTGTVRRNEGAPRARR